MLHATGSKKELTRLAYYALVSDILEHADVQALKQFRHHRYTTRFQHSLNVSYYNYLLCRFSIGMQFLLQEQDCCTTCIFMRQMRMTAQNLPVRNLTAPTIRRSPCRMRWIGLR